MPKIFDTYATLCELFGDDDFMAKSGISEEEAVHIYYEWNDGTDVVAKYGYLLEKKEDELTPTQKWLCELFDDENLIKRSGITKEDADAMLTEYNDGVDLVEKYGPLVDIAEDLHEILELIEEVA